MVCLEIMTFKNQKINFFDQLMTPLVVVFTADWDISSILPSLPSTPLCIFIKKYRNSSHCALEWYFNRVQTLALLIIHIAKALWVQNCKLPATIAPWNIFQWGPNSSITNLSHWYGLMSSKLQNSGHYNPMEWYFNGVQRSFQLSWWHEVCNLNS